MEQTPRVSAAHLDRFQTSPAVRLIGKVASLSGATATLDAAGSVTLLLNRDAHLTVGHGAEIVGKVSPNLEVRVLQAMDLGPNVDYNAVQAVVDATHRHKEIFYD